MRFRGSGRVDPAMSLSSDSSLRLELPFAWGGRLFIPVIRILSIPYEKGGIGLCTPVALLIEEGSVWSFVSLDPHTNQECLGELELPHCSV